MTEVEKSSALQELYRDYVNRVETRMTWNEFFNGVEKLFSKTPESAQPQNEEKQETEDKNPINNNNRQNSLIMKPKIAYNKDTVLLEKYEYFFGEELVLNDNEFQALLDVAIEIERSHTGMDKETFKAKMTKFCEGIANGMIKKAVIDGLTDYLKK